MRPGRRERSRARRLAVGLLACGGAAFGLAACSNGGTSLAQQACAHVDASIRLYDEAVHASDPAAAERKASMAAAQLARAEPLAALANSADPAFNPLMTTLQEAARTSEANLIPALRAQCSAAQSTTGQTTPTGGTAPMPSTGSGPSTLPTGGTG